MSLLPVWKSSTAAFMSITMTTAAVSPLLTLAPVQAQYNLNNLNQSHSIPANVKFPVTYEKEKIILNPGETLSLTLKIPNNIIDKQNNVLIPANTQVTGELQPVNINDTNSSTNDHKSNRGNQGVRFVANELVFDSGKHQKIQATSKTITATETISQGTDTSHVLTDAAIGAGAGAVLSLITGDHNLQVLPTLGGAVAGASASVLLRKKKANVFVIRPAEDLPITLNADLTLDRN
jgi:LPXTG-motif cell wall-anchored protein